MEIDITIQKRFITELKLKGNDLLIFSFISSWNWEYEEGYDLGVHKLANYLHLNYSTVINSLNKLIDEKLVKRTDRGVGYSDIYSIYESGQ